MIPRRLLTPVAVLVLLASVSRAAEHGLIAQWNFDEGKGEVVRDRSGNNNHGKIHGAKWVARRQGHALWFDGEDDYVDCGAPAAFDLRKTVAVEVWVKPEGNPGVDVGIAGKHYANYGLTFYKGRYWWYISGGGNNVKSGGRLGSWQHVVATFDGKLKTLYVDGKMTASEASQAPAIEAGKSLHIGCIVGDPSAADPAQTQSGYFSGRIGRVRLYDRALSLDEVRQHYVAEAAGYVNASRLDRLQVAVYPYFRREEVIAEVDWSELLEVPEKAPIHLHLAPAAGGDALMARQASATAKDTRIEVKWATTDLVPGDYAVHASLGGKQAEQAFAYIAPPPLRLPSPDERTAAPLPSPPKPVAFGLKLSKGGGFTLKIAGERYAFESSFSYPHGGENRLTVSRPRDRSGEESWRPKGRRTGRNTYTVRAAGAHYVLDRHLTVLPDCVDVRDTFTNRTQEDLGVIVRNHLNTRGKGFESSYLAGYKGVGVRREECSPSVFVANDKVGIGIVPADDVYIVHSEVYSRRGAAGVSTDRFALGPGASYTLEWSVYPNRTGDYYDFLNAFRKHEGRIGTVEGGLDFANMSMSDRTLRMSPEFVRRRNLRYATLMCLSHPVDDPEISIEGIEFMDFPGEMAVLKEKMAELHAACPDVKGMFHVAHSLYVTDRPDERFPDSRVVDRNGKQALWEDARYSYISKKRQDAGWKWWIFYPTPGNSFHDALMKSADVMMDELGCRGVFTDGLMHGYISKYTFDRWDGHTAEIDPETKTIQRKMGSVLLLSQPSVVEFVRKINAKGGAVIANNCVITRTFAREKVIVNREVIGPDSQLAPTVVCLGLPSAYLKDSTALYPDLLKALDYGSLYFLCGVGPQVRADSLAARMYPITCEEIRSGMVKGPERIVTARSGVYGWQGSADLAFVCHYDGRGVRMPHTFVSTAGAAGARTQVDLAENGSAVLERIPVSIGTTAPVNVTVTRYDTSGLELALHGRGKVRITLRSGAFPVAPETPYRVSATTDRTQTSDAAGTLSFDLDLDGPLAVSVLPAHE